MHHPLTQYRLTQLSNVTDWTEKARLTDAEALEIMARITAIRRSLINRGYTDQHLDALLDARAGRET